MTTKTNKARSVFLALLVVCSVFASTFAFAGTAAAATSDLRVPTSAVGPGDDVTVAVNVSGDNSASAVFALDADQSDSIESDEALGSAVTDGGESDESDTPGVVQVTLTLPPKADLAEAGDYTLVAEENESISPQANDQFSASATLSITDWDNDDVVSTDNNALVFAGQSVSFDANEDESGEVNDSYVLRSGAPDGDNAPEGQLTLTADENIDVNTSELSTGSYYITNQGPSEADLQFEVVQQQFSVNAASDSVETGASENFNVRSDNRRGSFDVVVTSESFSDDTLVDIFGGFNANVDGEGDASGDGILVRTAHEGEISADFTDVQPGDYEFDFDVADTAASDSASITVTKAGETSVDFEDDSVTVESGDSDWVNVTLENTKEGILHLGSDDDGYNVTARVVDNNEDGQVNVSLNTYNPSESNDFGLSAPNAGDEVVLLNSGNEFITNTYEGGDERLDAGSYEMEVRTGVDATADSVGTLSVLERSTDGAQTWVSHDNALDENTLPTTEELLSAIENDEIVQRDTVAKNDLAIVQVQASGVFGYLASDSVSLGDYYADGDAASDQIAFKVEQTNPGPNQDPHTVSQDAIKVVMNDDKNVIYYLIDTSEDSGIEAGQSFNASFTVKGDSKLNDDKQDQQVTTEFSVTERAAEFDVNDDDVVEVVSDENATISGESTLAPGSKINLYVRSVQGASTPFAMTETANVSTDGTFSAEFDFSEQDVGTNFTVTASTNDNHAFDDGKIVVDGTVVSAASDDCPKADNSCNVDDGNSTDEPTTDEPTTDEPSTDDTTTETTTPGFGALVAVIALVGAALLAVRRE